MWTLIMWVGVIIAVAGILREWCICEQRAELRSRHIRVKLHIVARR
jgi:hypothetical protein